MTDPFQEEAQVIHHLRSGYSTAGASIGFHKEDTEGSLSASPTDHSRGSRNVERPPSQRLNSNSSADRTEVSISPKYELIIG